MATVDYGTDLSCVTDLDPTGALLTGCKLLAEALARRLQTPARGLFYDPTYGLDLRECLNEAYTPQDIAALERDIAAECRKDERVLAVRAQVLLDAIAHTMTVSLLIADGSGPFALVLSVTNVTLTILQGP